MRTTIHNSNKSHNGRLTAIFVITGAILGVAADLTFGLPLLGTSVGAAFGLWFGAAADSIAQVVSGPVATA